MRQNHRPHIGIQQIQLRTIINNEKTAWESLRLVKEAGFDCIELNAFMINRMPMVVKLLTALAGMPVGRAGKLDWPLLVERSGLKVIALHQDLNSVLGRTQEVVNQADRLGTDIVVVTGMFRFDFSKEGEVLKLAHRLEKAGEKLQLFGKRLMYHNHNSEFKRVESGKMAFELLTENTEPELVNFELDAYWIAEAGMDPAWWMDRMQNRIKLLHISDRGSRHQGPSGSIIKSDIVELGTGNMNLELIFGKASQYGVEAVILETHRNWIDKSSIKSFQISGKFLQNHL